MATLAEFRKQYPQYDDMSDKQLADSLYQKFYSDMPREKFDETIGYSPSITERIGSVVEPVVSVAGKIAGAVRGKQDPRTADLPVYQGDTPDLIRGRETAKSVTFDDEAYGDILKTQLGNRFVRMDRDANNYPIIVYKGQDGSEKRAYVNRPGLDWQDVDRAGMATLPFLAGAGAAGRVGGLFGAGWKTLAGLQAGAGAGTSVAADLAAGSMGSEQGVNIPRAATAGAFGGLTQVAGPTISGGIIGTAAGAAAGDTPEERVAGGLMGGLTGILGGRLVDRGLRTGGASRHLKDGKLASPEARAAAQRQGFNPDEMSAEEAEMFARGINVGADEAEIAAAIKTNRFGIPTTKGQRTKDPQLLSVEKDIRYGNLGQDAKRVLEHFDADQQRAIRDAALQRAPRPGEPVNRVDRGDPYKEGVGSMIAPHRVNEPLDPASLGQDIGSALKSAHKAGNKKIDEAWSSVQEMVPAPEAFQSLPGIVSSKLGTIPVDDAVTPTAMRMAKDLDVFMKGNGTVGATPDVIQQQSVKSLDQMRRRLLALRDGASNSTDRAASKAIYDGFNDWIDDVADKGLATGADPASAAALRTAREVTKDIKQLFAPKDRRGRATPESRILDDIIEKDHNADQIVATLLGNGGAHTVPKAGSLAALNSIKKILDPKRGLIDESWATRTWDDIRMAYWSRLVMDKKGGMASPTVAQNNINAALRNQPGMIKMLFSGEEVRVIKDFARAVGEAAYKDPNPSGTASALRAMNRNESGNWLKTFFETQQKRELFSKHNVIMSRFYQFLAKKVPVNPLGARDAAGVAAARRAASQDLSLKPAPSRSGIGGAAGALTSDFLVGR
jgi:hypothetical protein